MPELDPDGVPDLGALYRRYAPYVATIAFRMTGRDADVDDIVSETFYEAVRCWDRLEDRNQLKGWLATVAVRVAGKRLRRRRLRQRLGIERRAEYEEVASPDASPEQRALLARVYQALDRLPTEERFAWTLRHIEGEDLQTIAERLDLSLATVKRRIAAARTRLQKELGRG